MSITAHMPVSSPQNANQEPMFRILKSNWNVIEYSGSENIIVGKKPQDFIGQPFYSLLELKKSDNPLEQLTGKSSPRNRMRCSSQRCNRTKKY